MKIKSTSKSSRVTHYASRITHHALRSRAPAPPALEPRRGGLWWLAVLIMALLAVGPGPAFAQSGIPNIINYQGKLTDDLGRPVPAGAYQVTFKIWDVPDTSDPSDYIWGRTLAVHVVTNGLFNVLLSDGTPEGNPRTTSLLQAFDGDQRYLGLTIAMTPSGTPSSTSEISPRQRLVTAPFAIHSYSAYTATWAMGATNAGSATNAAFASTAAFASNAGTLSGLTANDFLWVNKPAQTLNGSLTLNSNLIANTHVCIGNTNPNFKLSFADELGDKINLYGTPGTNYGFGIQHFALQIHSDLKASDVVFGYGPSTNLTETFRIKGTGEVKVAGGQSPIVIRRYPLLPDPVNLRANYYLPNQPFSYTNWSAAIIGFTCAGDFPYSGAPTDYMLDVSMQKTNGNWVVQFDLQHHQYLNNVKVDVMYIRKELTDDDR
jgi:hypothetical protein